MHILLPRLNDLCGPWWLLNGTADGPVVRYVIASSRSIVCISLSDEEGPSFGLLDSCMLLELLG
jgi:hypothetical protein